MQLPPELWGLIAARCPCPRDAVSTLAGVCRAARDGLRRELVSNPSLVGRLTAARMSAAVPSSCQYEMELAWRPERVVRHLPGVVRAHLTATGKSEPAYVRRLVALAAAASSSAGDGLPPEAEVAIERELAVLGQCHPLYQQEPAWLEVLRLDRRLRYQQGVERFRASAAWAAMQADSAGAHGRLLLSLAGLAGAYLPAERVPCSRRLAVECALLHAAEWLAAQRREDRNDGATSDPRVFGLVYMLRLHFDARPEGGAAPAGPLSCCSFTEVEDLQLELDAVECWHDATAGSRLVQEGVMHDLVPPAALALGVCDWLVCGGGGLDATAAEAGCAEQRVRAVIAVHHGHAAADGRPAGTPLVSAARAGRARLIPLLLACADVDPNATDPFDGATALVAAAKTGSPAAVEALLAHPGCDPNAPDQHGYAALHQAVLMWRPDMVRMLLRHAGTDANAQTEREGWTALHLAVREDARDIATLLEGHAGTHLDVRDYTTGMTPLQLAEQLGRHDTYSWGTTRTEPETRTKKQPSFTARR